MPFLFHCKPTWHPSCPQPFHVQILRHTTFFKNLSYLLASAHSVDCHPILFCRFSSPFLPSFGRPLRCSSWQIMRPRLNSAAQYFIGLQIHLEHSILTHVKQVLNSVVPLNFEFQLHKVGNT